MAKLDRIRDLASSPQWQQQQADKAKALETMPPWQQFGFGSETQYNNVYNPTANAPAPGPAPLDPSDPFGDYLSRNPEARDAWAYLEAVLAEYGLGELNSFIKENIIEGRSEVEIKQRLRENEVYKKRFAVIEELKQAGLPPMSETEVVEWEKAATQLMQRAQLPKGFYDSPEDFKNFMVKGWSVSELESVLVKGYTDSQNADPLVRSEIERLFGPGTLTAFFIDPEKTEAIAMQQYQAARLGAQARSTGFGNLSRTEAEELAALGITEEQGRSGFGTLTANSELFGALPGQQGGIDRATQMRAAFRGDVGAQQAIEKVGRERANVFGERGQFATDDQGFAGLGRAR